jgi:hypothetical protein
VLVKKCSPFFGILKVHYCADKNLPLISFFRAIRVKPQSSYPASLGSTFFFEISFYLQSLPVHSANFINMYQMAYIKVLRSTPLLLIGSKPVVNWEC